MPKNLLNALGSFGEGFISTLQSERERKQKELESQQKIDSERRQQKLTGAYYDALTKNMQIDNNLAEAKFGTEQRSGYDVSMDSLSPVGTLGKDLNKQFNGMFSPFEEDKRYTPKQQEGTAPSYQIGSRKENGKDMQYFYNPKNPKEQIPFGEEYHSPAGNTTVNVDTGEYFDMTKSDKVSKEYNAIQGAKYNPKTEKYEILTGSGTAEFTADQIKTLKSRYITDIENSTNDEARRIGKKVKGFYTKFQAYLNDKSITPENIDESVNKDFPDAPSEVRESMKNLLKKRKF